MRKIPLAVLIALALLGTTGASRTEQDPEPSTFFSTVGVEQGASATAEGDGDLWPSCWAGDGHLYAAHGDGKGFGDVFSDIGVNRITGDPGNLSGETLALGDQVGQVWSGDNFTRKPTGMACVDGAMYLAVQDLRKDFNEVPAATIARSTDGGRTWTWDRQRPMFDDHKFTTIMFLDYGQNNAGAPDDHVYAYGLDNNWRDSFDDSVPDPEDVYLARVPAGAVQDRSKWEFFSGTAGAPSWSSEIGERRPVLHDGRRLYKEIYSDQVSNLSVISQGSVVYNKPLDRYIYSSWTEYTFEFYEAPTPWGPWRRFKSKDFGGYPWWPEKHGGYATTIPSKFIGADGRSMWVQSNVCPCGGGTNDPFAYKFSLRKLRLEPFSAGEPDNRPDCDRNLAREDGTEPIERAVHFGPNTVWSDGDKNNSEDDWNDERKSDSFWGYTWRKPYTMDKVVYTTGKMFGDGGWFAETPRVQVRKDHRWADVTGLKVTPGYPASGDAGPNKTYTLSFDAVAGDGVRVIGRPGGSRTFTSAGELEVYYSG